jgi:hypothetical protein
MRPSGVDELCQVGGLGEASYRVNTMMCKRRSQAELLMISLGGKQSKPPKYQPVKLTFRRNYDLM